LRRIDRNPGLIAGFPNTLLAMTATSETPAFAIAKDAAEAN
jgi:hypothetical protein